MTKTYDIRKIEELHRLRADLYEERKHLSPEERRAVSNAEGRSVLERAESMKRASCVLKWDPNFSKVTPDEAARIKAAEESGFVDEEDIDWDKIGR